MTLNKEELIHPIFYLIFITVPILGLSFDFLPNFYEKAFLIYFVLIFFKISHSVKLKGNEIVDGIYLSPFGFLKIKKRMRLDDIKEIIIFKNEKKYSEIRAISSNDFLIIKTIANKIPAEEELIEIQTKIDSRKEIIQKFN